MMTRKQEIEKRLSEIKAAQEVNAELDRKQSELYGVVREELEMALKAKLENAGLQNVVYARGSKLWGDAQVEMRVTADTSTPYPKDTLSMDITVNGKGITRYSTWSHSGEHEHVEQSIKLYAMAADTLKFFRDNTPLIAELVTMVESSKPERLERTGPTNNELRKEEGELNGELKRLSLEVGAKIEIFEKGTRRWERDHWVKVTVTKVTAKRVTYIPEGRNFEETKEIKWENIRIIDGVK